MPTLDIAGKSLEVDGEGFLVNSADWDREIAQAIATEEGIPALTERHWTVIDFARKFHEENGESPTMRKITKVAGVPTKELYELFPQGPGKKISRIAGTPKPEGCV